MKKKVKIKFLKHKEDIILLNVRGKEISYIINRNPSDTFRNKKKYYRKIKHKNKEE